MPPRLDEALKTELASGHARPFRVATASELAGFTHVGRCDANAAAFVSKHSRYEVVEGWVALSQIWFIKHVVIRKGAGPLICVTWAHNMPRHEGFIVHCHDWDPRPFSDRPDQVWA